MTYPQACGGKLLLTVLQNKSAALEVVWVMKSAAVTVVVFVCLAGLSLPGYTWGWGAHIYIAERVLAPFPNSDMVNQARYGSILPDVYDIRVLLHPGSEPILRDLTHSSGFDMLSGNVNGDIALGWFVAGWRTHNQLWGADYFGHVVSPLQPGLPGYVYMKAAALPELGKAAHGYIEGAIDILIRKKLDGGIGDKIRRAATNRRSTIPYLLSNTYAPPYSPTNLRRAEDIFRGSAAAYGEALDMRGSLNKYAFADTLGRANGIGFKRSLNYLERAIKACDPDFRQAIDAAIVLVSENNQMSLQGR